MSDLPIYEIENELVQLLREQSRVVLQAPTGSGKSTQVPQMLLDRGLLGSGMAVVLQPRRLPARMLAKRVAEERRATLGQEVGYQVRLDNRSSGSTRIKFETEGVLLRQMLTNPDLDGISAIIFDEFHERHIYGDVTLARALEIQQVLRPDLKLLVMSATLDIDLVIKYLDPCELLVSEGRTYPVTTEYLRRATDPGKEPVWQLAAKEFSRLVSEGHEGDVLVFMPGAYEIHRTVEEIRRVAGSGFLVMPLHGELPVADQDAAVARYDRRKVVVATNVAETSLTIDGIRLVIDSGLARVARFDPHRGINTLLVERISRASAEQRAGRGGRTAPGHCMRLWTEREQGSRAPREVPEVKRIDLSEVILALKAGGVGDMDKFAWVESPGEKSLERAHQLLTDLGALHVRTGAVTPVGQRMVAFPVHPRYARMLLAAGELDCVREAALIAALTQGRSILVRTRDRKILERRSDMLGEDVPSDFIVLMRAWSYADRYRYDLGRCKEIGVHAGAARQVAPLYERFLGIAERNGLRVNDLPATDEAVQRCVLAGFSDQVAHRRDSGSLRCDVLHGRSGELARESVVRDSRLLVASEYQEIEGRRNELNVLLTLATAVEEAWLEEDFPDDFNSGYEVELDRTTKRVTGWEVRRFRDLVLERKRSAEVPEDQAAAILAREIMAGRSKLKKWDHAVDQYLLRVRYVAERYPEMAFPDLYGEDREALVSKVCRGAMSLKELKDRPVMNLVKAQLNPGQRDLLEKMAPERLQLPDGPRPKLVYQESGPPVLSACIQDLYGVKDALRLPGGDPVLIHVLAPNHRPVQVTQDLSTFWRDAYPKVKAQMQRKYPKHKWR
jgi:ATP-dependent helicase HrpB